MAVFDASGRELIDKIAIPGAQHSNMSYGYMETEDDAGEVSGEWEYLEKITPASNNDHSRKTSSGEKFVKHDPSGLGMAMIAMAVVFSALALLYIIFKNIGALFQRKAKKESKQKTAGVLQVQNKKQEEISGEVNAAIAMALYLYQNEMHDDENMVFTIKRIREPILHGVQKFIPLVNTQVNKKIKNEKI